MTDFPTDVPVVDPADASNLHPLQFLEQLKQAAAMPAAPSMPSVPSAPAAPEGDGVRGLLRMLAPVLGGLAMGGGAKQTGFLNGYSEGQQAVSQEKERKAQQDQQRAKIAADFVQKISDQADQITDPAQWSHFVDTADATAARAKLTQPGEIKNQLAFPRQALAAKQLKDLTGQLDAFEKAGYNLDDLASSGAVVKLSDGTSVPVSMALSFAQRPMDARGAPITKPAKAAATEEERYVQKWAMENGLKPETLTADQELTARKQFRDAGRADKSDKVYPPGGVDAQFNDLVELWKSANPGKEPPADVRTRLRKQANEVNDRPNNGMGGPAGNSALDPEGIDYAATEYRVTGKMPALGMGNGAARAAIINTAAKQARTLGQSAAAAIQKQAAYKSDGASLTKMSTMSAAAEAFETKALAQADIVDGLSQKVSRTNYPIINDGLLTAKARIGGDTNTQLLYNALTTFTNEYAKIMDGSTGSAAGSTDSARASAAKLISAGLSKGTLSQTLDLMRREMRLTIQGYDATKAHITERMGGQVPPTTSGSTNRIYYDVNGNPIKK